MKLLKHVFYSWLLAIGTTLAGVFTYYLMSGGSYLHMNMFRIQFITILLVVFAIALPSLFISWLFFGFIYITPYTIYEKFFLGVIAAFIAVVLNIFLVALVFVPHIIEPDIFFMLWPAYAGLLLSLSLRHKHFIQLFDINALREKNSEENQTTI